MPGQRPWLPHGCAIISYVMMPNCEDRRAMLRGRIGVRVHFAALAFDRARAVGKELHGG
jgi:hypothetical protein